MLVSCGDSPFEEPCPAVADAREFIVGSDQNGDERLTNGEFRSAIERNSPDQHPAAFVTETFDSYDTDDDGYLTIEEMQRLARQVCREA
jgi:Ca2+-binding EF-hand superfamily protein